MGGTCREMKTDRSMVEEDTKMFSHVYLHVASQAHLHMGTGKTD